MTEQEKSKLFNAILKFQERTLKGGSEYKEINILVVGDLMVDEYIFGESNEISREAPVPIVVKKETKRYFGGTGNVVNNLKAMGANVSVFGVVGNDKYGRLVEKHVLEDNKYNSVILITHDRPTIIKQRIVVNGQQIVRVDTEKSSYVSDNCEKLLTKYITDQIHYCDVVVLSDYNKGALTPKLIKRIIKCAESKHKPVIVDPKGDNFSLYYGATVITPNLLEAELVCKKKLFPGPGASLNDAARSLCVSCDFDQVVITCGENGIFLFNDNKNLGFYYPASNKQSVYDVSGAGDTVLSVLSICLALEIPLQFGIYLANIAGDIAVRKLGTSTVTSKQLSDIAIKSLAVVIPLR